MYGDAANHEYGENPEQGAELLQEKRKTCRRQLRCTCTVLGWSLTLFIVLTLCISLLIQLGAEALLSFGNGGSVLYDIVNSNWFAMGGITLLTYAIVLPFIFAIMSRVPENRTEPKKMRFRKFVMFFVLIQGGGTFFNFIGNMINFTVSMFSGRSMLDMNPVNTLLDGMDLLTILYIALLGPIIEEYIFRWKLVNRLRAYGDRTAIVYSALMFGLMHGNVTQFLYAAFIGLILGYISVKTGRLLYNCLLHILVNSGSVLLVLLTSDQSVLSVVISLGTLFVTLAMVVGAIVITCIKAGKLRLGTGSLPDGVMHIDIASAAYLNSGTIAFIVVCVGMMLFYLFAS